MNTSDSIKTESKNILNLIAENWSNLDDSQKVILTKIWKVLTYKWKLQILLNLPFLIWFALDKSIPQVHKFDIAMLSYLNVPEWALSFIGFGK